MLAELLRDAVESGDWSRVPVETAWGCAELAWWVPRARAALERLGGAP